MGLKNSSNDASLPACVHPSQQSLNALFSEVTRVQITNSTSRGRVLFWESATATKLAELAAHLTIYETRDGGQRLIALGTYHFELYSDQLHLASIGFQLRGAIWLTPAWTYDAPLRDGKALIQWLAEQGVTSPLKDLQDDARRLEEQRLGEIRWYNAIPTCLQPYWDGMQGFIVDLEPLRQALASAYPDRSALILALFGWYGSGRGRWSGFPMYESVPENLLLEYSTEELVAVVSRHPLSEEQMEGAVRYFGGWHFERCKPNDRTRLPSGLKKLLLEHSLKSIHEDNRAYARHAFREV